MLLGFTSFAFADETAVGASAVSSSSSFLTNMMPLFLIMLVFYFLLIRPQQKKAKQHQNMLQSLKKGDQVVIAGGVFGVISKVNENAETVSIEIAENVKIKAKRESILEILNSNAVQQAKSD